MDTETQSSSEILVHLTYDKDGARCNHYKIVTIPALPDGPMTVDCNEEQVTLGRLDPDTQYNISVTVISNYTEGSEEGEPITVDDWTC